MGTRIEAPPRVVIRNVEMLDRRDCATESAVVGRCIGFPETILGAHRPQPKATITMSAVAALVAFCYVSGAAALMSNGANGSGSLIFPDKANSRASWDIFLQVLRMMSSHFSSG